MNGLTELLRRAASIYRTEGLLSLARRAGVFGAGQLFKYEKFYLYECDASSCRSRGDTEFVPDVDGLSFRVISTNHEADELQSAGFQFREHAGDARSKFSKGAIAFCVFVGHELGNIAWLCTTEQARDGLNEPPPNVDFSQGEAWAGGAWTNPKYRRVGLHTYCGLKRDEWWLEKGILKTRWTVARTNAASLTAESKVGSVRYGEGRLIKVLWWKSWKETPLTGHTNQRHEDRESEYWSEVATRWAMKPGRNPLIAEHKRNTYLSLIQRWLDVRKYRRILKTDLFDEAFDEDFLSEIAAANPNIVGLDVSREVVSTAKRKADDHGLDGSSYICCNVKHLPLQSGCMDLIISDSTLDHFPTELEIIAALRELGRVLSIGGILILSIDNNGNLTYPPYPFVRLWMRLGLAPYFVGRTLSLTNLKQTLEKAGLVVEESTAIIHYPHPEALMRWLERSLSELSRGKLDNAIRKNLARLDRLERKKTKYLTGRYLAVKAVKVR